MTTPDLTRQAQHDFHDLHTHQTRPYGRRRHSHTTSMSFFANFTAILLFFATVSSPAAAAFLEFDNCLSDSIKRSSPLELQWIPLYVDVHFARTNAGRNLNVTVYGNVSGQAVQGTYPPPNSPDWTNPNVTFGKIVNSSQANNKFTTLFNQFDFLSYTPYDAAPSPFYLSTINVSVPIAPAFSANASNPYSLPAFSVAHDFSSSYAFTTLTSTIKVQSGDASAAALACISTNITPALTRTISRVLTFLPAVVLILVAVATVFAATLSPWGSSDPFIWSSNYGRDEDLLRLVTPGFGDCLQYIQFIVLAGALSLNYPGYFQPVVSKVGWSALMFNESFVSHGPGHQSLVDGIYTTKGTYGLARMSQLIGMTAVRDIWACMVVWLAVIVGIVVVLCQLGFLVRWALRQLTNRTEEDLRRKNWPFTGGNIVRIVCVYFLLPIISLSMFQLVVAPRSPAVVTAFAVVLLVAIFAFGGWILRLIFSTKPRSHLFDDLPTVLLYGPLYNTYSDEVAPFALVPALLTVIRGIAIGAVQPSGIAQLIMLAICEVVLILTLYAFRPFNAPTSMNAYHTFFAAIRLIVILLSVAFVPSLDVAESYKGWIGYVVLLLHAVVLVFGFFLNALQTLVEVAARLGGAGGDEGTGAATRGGLVKVFGMRQLSRRARRPGFRDSMHSDAAMLTDDADAKSALGMNRTRSVSASSAILLNRRPLSTQPSGEFDPNLICDVEQDTPGEHGSFTFLPSSGDTMTAATKRPDLHIRTTESADPYFRRPRRATGDKMTPGAKSRGSWNGGDWSPRNYAESTPDQTDSFGRPASSSPVQLGSGPIPLRREDPDLNPSRSNVDYAVREVDFYYGVRGPALSNQPTRKLKTGPADPMGPVSSAQGWFKGMFGRKNNESGKAFEVVRSSRVPSKGMGVDSAGGYHDVPSQASPADGKVQAPRTKSALEPRNRGNAHAHNRQREPDIEMNKGNSSDDFVDDGPSPINSDDEEALQKTPPPLHRRVSDVPDLPRPRSSGSLGGTGTLGSPRTPMLFHRPSRGNLIPLIPQPEPTLPRKSSKRKSSLDDGPVATHRLSTVTGSPALGASRSTTPQPRVPFTAPLSPVESNPRHSSGAESVKWQDIDHDDDKVDPVSTPNLRNLRAPLGLGLDRPTSMGFVTQYRASDSIHPGLYDITAHEGSAAEVVDNSWRQNGGYPQTDWNDFGRGK